VIRHRGAVLRYYRPQVGSAPGSLPIGTSRAPPIWFLEPETGLARIYRQGGETLLLAAELSVAAGDVLTTPLLTGLSIPLADLFR